MTEKATELSKRLVVGHKRDGRSCYDKEAKRELIEACLRPGVSIARMDCSTGSTRICFAPGSLDTVGNVSSCRPAGGEGGDRRVHVRAGGREQRAGTSECVTSGAHVWFQNSSG